MASLEGTFKIIRKGGEKINADFYIDNDRTEAYIYFGKSFFEQATSVNDFLNVINIYAKRCAEIYDLELDELDALSEIDFSDIKSIKLISNAYDDAGYVTPSEEGYDYTKRLYKSNCSHTVNRVTASTLIDLEEFKKVIGNNKELSLSEWRMIFKFITKNNKVTITQYKGDAKEVVIPEKIGKNIVAAIGEEAFFEHSQLTSVTIPNSVTSIGSDAFRGCSGLTNITIPDNVTTIGGGAFSNTAWYKNQPDGLVYAGKVAYKYKGACPKTVEIKDGTRSIASGAFEDCRNLTSITIPDSVAYIGRDAFCGCDSLTSITIPNGVTEIGWRTFYGCINLTSITIPDSVTEIGFEAIEIFDDSAELTIYAPAGSYAEQYAKDRSIKFVAN